MKFVIIGGDAAGMSAASRAKRNDPSMDVVVLEQTNDVSYSACGMPYNIGDPQRQMDDLVVRKAEVFREKQNIDLRLGRRVERIDREAKTVSGKTSEGESFEVPYSHGRSAHRPGHTGEGSSRRHGVEITGEWAQNQGLSGCEESRARGDRGHGLHRPGDGRGLW